MQHPNLTIPDLPAGIHAVAESQRKRYPCHSNRASSIGYFVPELEGCVRRGVYERTQWQEKELWDAESILRFREGDMQEKQILKDLSDAGFTVIEQQTAFEWKEHQITGHIDGKLLVDDVAVPLEIKSASPMIFPKIRDWESLLLYPWLRAYQGQVTMYMLMQGIDIAILLFKDKSSGVMKQVVCKLDYQLGEWCIQAAEAINKHVAAGTMPEQIQNRETCKRCPFRHLCLPDIEFGEPLKINDDPLFEERLDEALQLKESSARYKKLWDIVKEEAKASAGGGELNMMVGKYHLSAKAGKTFRLNVEVI